MSEYSYSREKLFNAINILATGPGDVRSRLWSAYLEAHTLKADNFPEELRGDWQFIYDNLTKYGSCDYKNVGSVQHTLRRIKNKTGSRIADKFFHLFCEMCLSEKYC